MSTLQLITFSHYTCKTLIKVGDNDGSTLAFITLKPLNQLYVSQCANHALVSVGSSLYQTVWFKQCIRLFSFSFPSGQLSCAECCKKKLTWSSKARSVVIADSHLVLLTWVCDMTFGVMNDYTSTLILRLQITKSDIRLQIKWAVHGRPF